MSRVGQALFAARGWVPVPLILLFLTVGRGPGDLLFPGIALLGLGECLRLWAVAHIGPRSRTRGAEADRVVTTGPYAWCRNPLYLANLLLFAGVGLWTGHLWAPALAVAVLGAHYGLIIRWEEENLAFRLGEPYRAWCATTPRWWPRPPREAHAAGEARWRVALRSERSTLLAILLVGTAVAWAPLRGM